MEKPPFLSSYPFLFGFWNEIQSSPVQTHSFGKGAELLSTETETRIISIKNPMRCVLGSRVKQQKLKVGKGVKLGWSGGKEPEESLPNY